MISGHASYTSHIPGTAPMASASKEAQYRASETQTHLNNKGNNVVLRCRGVTKLPQPRNQGLNSSSGTDYFVSKHPAALMLRPVHDP